MTDSSNKWTQPASPPVPLFLNSQERDFISQVNNELIEQVIGQNILYYPIDVERSNFHSMYGESIKKSFLPPIQCYCLVEQKGKVSDNLGNVIDIADNLVVHFHKRRLTEDKNLSVTPGDFLLYGQNFYEIVSLAEPRQIFGQVGRDIEVSVNCVRARDGLFNAE